MCFIKYTKSDFPKLGGNGAFYNPQIYHLKNPLVFQSSSKKFQVAKCFKILCLEFKALPSKPKPKNSFKITLVQFIYLKKLWGLQKFDVYCVE